MSAVGSGGIRRHKGGETRGARGALAPPVLDREPGGRPE